MLTALLMAALQDPLLLQTLENESAKPEDRAAAARLLGTYNTRYALPALIKAMQAKEAVVREAANDALKKITGVDTLEPTYEAWNGWWQKEGIKLFADAPGGEAVGVNHLQLQMQEIKEDYKDLRDRLYISLWSVIALWLAFLVALIYFAGHLSSKLKEWKDVMKQADQYLRESEEVTKRTDRIIDELEAKKTEIVDFFSKLKDDNESELERFADLLEQNTEHRIRLEVMALRQKAEKEIEQTIGELKAAVDHEVRRAANEHRRDIEKQLDQRQKEFLAQIEAHSLYLEASFYNSQGRHEEALRVFKRLVEVRPDHHVAWTSMGNVLRDMMRFDEAIESHQRALEFSPQDAKVHYHLAQTYARMKRKDNMLSALQRAFSANGEELKDEALNDPLFQPYWNDPAFKDLAEA